MTEEKTLVAQSAKNPVDTLFEKAVSEMKEIEKVKQQLEEMKQKSSATVKALKAANGKPTFERNGKYYVIKNRGGTHFICESDVPWGSWLKNRRKKDK